MSGRGRAKRSIKARARDQVRRRRPVAPEGPVVVVGGGIAGLATAALLATEGRDVTLVEATDEVGGRAGSWSSGGFRFDTGPSWFLMPEVFDHFFRLCGTSLAEQLDLVRLDPGYRVYFENQPVPVDVRSDRAASTALFESLEPGAGAVLGRYLDSARITYDLALRRFLYTNFTSRGRCWLGSPSHCSRSWHAASTTAASSRSSATQRSS